MGTLAISPLFSNWSVEKSEAGSVVVSSNGAANINAGVGSTAYLLFPVAVYPGDTIEFSCMVAPVTGEGLIGIFEDTTGSGFNNIKRVSTRTLQELTITYTARMDADVPQSVFCKVGIDTSTTGSLTVMQPKIRVLRDTIGTKRTAAFGVITHHRGNDVNINRKWAHTGIERVYKKDANTIALVYDNIPQPADAGAEYAFIPTPTVQVSHNTSPAIQARITGYDQYKREVSIGFVQTKEGRVATLDEVWNCTLLFNADMI